MQSPSTIDTQERTLDAAWLRRICLDAGADDVGFVSIDRPEVAPQRDDAVAAFPHVRTLVSLVFRLNREPVRSPMRSAGNLEYHAAYHHANATARKIVAALEREGVRAMNPAAGFPMEMDRFPGKTWVVSHKPIAAAAGLGKIGIHRNVIHPRFGSFVVLDTILVDREISTESAPIDYNPCLECKLCVAACPVGAIGSDGHFDFSSCMTHNYREFMSGFTGWVEEIADAKDARDYRSRVSDSETASMWQSLSFGPGYKAAYCIAVCPAGEDVAGPYLENKPRHLADVVKPLQKKEEPVYVLAGSDAEEHVAKRFPHKRVRRVRNALRPSSIQGFLFGLSLRFQRNRSAGIDATYHFVFTGEEACEATVRIREKRIEVRDGLEGEPDVRVTADGRAWLRTLARDERLLWAVLRRKVRVAGNARLLRDFARCFPQ